MNDADEERRISLYEAVGGRSYFVELVDRFYDRVALDPVLTALYPDDLSEPRRNTAGFLMQFWGGPTDYSDERGHPRLRMRHAPFAIGQVERDAWMDHMRAAVAETPVPSEIGDDAVEAVKIMQLDYFERAATAMINQPV